MLNHVFRQLHRTRAIQVHHVQFGVQICFGKKATDTDPALRQATSIASAQRLHLLPELLYAPPASLSRLEFR